MKRTCVVPTVSMKRAEWKGSKLLKPCGDEVYS